MMISLSLDGMLTGDEEEDLKQHLQECPECADLMARMQMVDVMFRRPAEAAPPANFALRVMERVEAYQTRQRWSPWLVAVLAIVSVLAALSVATPVVILTLGLEQTVAEWPLATQIVLALSHSWNVLTVGVTLVSNLLYDWLAYLFTNPVTMAIVIGGLMLASVSIGLREGITATRQALAAAQQQA
jgi:anti-sigma factor RsiW